VTLLLIGFASLRGPDALWLSDSVQWRKMDQHGMLAERHRDLTQIRWQAFGLLTVASVWSLLNV
jgi:hypothetical protein